jgi:hypothetical protein
MYIFDIETNKFLNKETIGYYHQYYTGYGQPDNPEFLNILKNTYNNTSNDFLIRLEQAQNTVVQILEKDVRNIKQNLNWHDCMLVCVPRAKPLSTYSANQLKFKNAVKIVANHLSGVEDGTDCITRVVETRTTHIRSENFVNNGSDPYQGITQDTCEINGHKIKGKNIILVDDIYTKTVNIDEDVIQTLLNHGANNVVFYAVGYTKNKRQVENHKFMLAN